MSWRAPQQQVSDAALALLADLTQPRRVFDLGRPIHPGMPVARAQPPYLLSLAMRHGDAVFGDGISVATELIVSSSHVGTHIDAIGHVSRDGRLYGGEPADAYLPGGVGLAKLDAAEYGPFICTGVLLDVPAAKGVDALEAAYEITIADLEATLAAQGTEIRPDDAVLIRTGWGKHWHDSELFIGRAAGAPGLGDPAARWLVERKPLLTGSDTVAYEVRTKAGGPLPVHATLLADHGIPIIEVLQLDDLALAQAHRFVLLAIPLQLVGSTGSPVRPIALA